MHCPVFLSSVFKLFLQKDVKCVSLRGLKDSEMFSWCPAKEKKLQARKSGSSENQKFIYQGKIFTRDAFDFSHKAHKDPDLVLVLPEPTCLNHLRRSFTDRINQRMMGKEGMNANIF